MILTILFREQLYNVGYIIYMDFGFVDMLNRFVKIIRKNLIDIRFISIAVLVLLFASILVFKPHGFKEGMGLGYIEGEAPIHETVVETPIVDDGQRISGGVTDVSVGGGSVPVPNIDEPCSLCGVECPNTDNACLSSKPSCVMCQERVTERLNKKNRDTPIVVNVYTGGSVGVGDDDVVGAGPSKSINNANTDLGSLTRNAGFDDFAPADASGMAQDINNVNVRDLVDTEKIEKIQEQDKDKDKDANVEIESSLDEGGAEMFTNGHLYSEPKPKKMYPSMSYSIYNTVQGEIDKLPNL